MRLRRVIRSSVAWAKRLYRQTSPRRRVVVAAGSLCFLAGFVLLVVGLVGYFGSGSAPTRANVDLVDLRGQDMAILDLPSRSPTPRPTPTSSPSATPQPEPPLGDQPYRMVIEKINVDAPVKTFGLDENGVPLVPVGQEAKEVVAWYDFSARPGTGSNAVFAGHVTWYGAAVFYRLHTLSPGDSVVLRGDDGTEIVYKVSAVFQVDPSDPESLKVMHATDKDVITLITCGGSYVETGDPVFGGEYSHRVVVRAELAEVRGPAAVGAAAPAEG